jgi:trimeric autotransporter adhesin
MGPVSQDFHAAFGLGTNDRTITSIDETGVALLAIQGLNARHEDQAAQ